MPHQTDLYFYPRSPCGERRRWTGPGRSSSRFLSTLSLRRATLMWWQSNTTIKISIHALLAESDTYQEMQTAKLLISIHALLAESDAMPCLRTKTRRWRFLSTLSLRRATAMDKFLPDTYAISIHALLAESDRRKCTGPLPWDKFLSTLSLRRATRPRCSFYLRFAISIHALLAESDVKRHIAM